MGPPVKKIIVSYFYLSHDLQMEISRMWEKGKTDWREARDEEKKSIIKVMRRNHNWGTSYLYTKDQSKT